MARIIALQYANTTNTEPLPPFARFLQAWEAAATNTRTAYAFDAPFVSTILSSQSDEPQNIYCVDVPSFELPNDPTANLYDVLDNCFWPSVNNVTSSDEASFNQIAPIMVMSLSAKQKSDAHKLGVPATLYADRYLESSKDIVQQMRAELAIQYSNLEHTQEQLGKYDVFQHPTKSKVGSAFKLLDTAIEVITQHASEATAKQEEPMVEQDSSIAAGSASRAGEVLTRLERIHQELRATVDSKPSARPFHILS